MDRLLKPNLCGLEPNEWHNDRVQILDHNQHKILPCLAYACIYWASHLVAALDGGVVLGAEGGGLVEHFASTHMVGSAQYHWAYGYGLHESRYGPHDWDAGSFSQHDV
jgi:hypothetical protein